MNRRAAVGFDRRLDLAWLDAAAVSHATGATFADVRRALWDLLEGVVAGTDAHGGRGKTVTVLARAWASPSSNAAPLRARAVALLADASPDERLAIHWGILAATFPLFTDVAEVIGRFLAFHDTFRGAQVTQRMVDLWGDRTTVARAVSRVVASMVEWGALHHDVGASTYAGVQVRPVGPPVGAFLVRALLADGAVPGIPVKAIRTLPALFPFALGDLADALASDPAMEVHAQGFGDDVVELRRDPR